MGVLKLKDGQNWIPIKTIKGDSGVYVGDTEPDPSDYNVWIDPEGEDDTPQLINKADVITDSASGSIVSISDGMASPVLGLDVDLEPIQDLHGYDNPWPGGGGKNKIEIRNDIDTTNRGVLFKSKDGGVELSQTSTETYPQIIIFPYTNRFEIGETITISQTIDGTTPNGSHVYFIFREYDGDTTTVHSLRDNPTATFTITKPQQTLILVAEGNNITYSNVVAKFQAEYGYPATAWSPYSNICPISGRSEVSVTRTGKNLVHNTGTGRTSAGITYTVNEDGSVKASGTASGVSWWRGSTTLSDWVFIKAGTYHLSGGKSNNQLVYVVGQMIDGTPINNISIGNVYDKGTGLTFTLPKDGYLNYQIQIRDGEVVDDTFYPMIRTIGTDTYEPYQGQTVTIQLGQTVYGGTLDVASGKLTIDRYMWVLTNPLVSVNSTSGDNVTYDISLEINSKPNGVNYSYVSNRFSGSIPAGTPGRGVLVANHLYLVIAKSELSSYDRAGLLSWLSTNTTQVCYTLATPNEVTLTPEELDILFGDNNIWADSGDTTVEYRADTKLWILKKIAQALNA